VSAQDRSEIVGGQAGLAATVAAETHGELGEAEEIRARGYWENVWRRFRRDKLAIVSGFFIVFLVFSAFGGAPIAEHFLGHGPNDPYPVGGVDLKSFLPVGPWTTFHAPNPLTGKPQTVFFLFGGDGPLGRDEFLRILYGARVSLEVAVLSTTGVMAIGIVLGTIAGYFRGWIDTIISRVLELTMVFPALLFIIALSATVGPRLNHVTLGLFPQGVMTLVIVFTIFGWFYPARIIRAQVLSLREKEFVEAARMIGASDSRIMRSHILPHLTGPVIVFSTLNVAQFILAEAGLSYLGLGIKLPTASWGNLLEQATDFITTRPQLMLWPGIALVLTTLAFNLLGDGLRDAFDPRSTRR